MRPSKYLLETNDKEEKKKFDSAYKKFRKELKKQISKGYKEFCRQEKLDPNWCGFGGSRKEKRKLIESNVVAKLKEIYGKEDKLSEALGNNRYLKTKKEELSKHFTEFAKGYAEWVPTKKKRMRSAIICGAITAGATAGLGAVLGVTYALMKTGLSLYLTMPWYLANYGSAVATPMTAAFGGSLTVNKLRDKSPADEKADKDLIAHKYPNYVEAVA